MFPGYLSISYDYGLQNTKTMTKNYQPLEEPKNRF